MRFGMKSRLGLRLLVLVLVCNATLSAVATAIQLYASFQRQSDVLHEVARDVERGFHKSLTTALWAFDDSQVNLLLDGISANADIVSLRLTSGDEDSWTRGFPIEQSDLSVETIELIYPHERRGDILVGTLEMGISRQRIWDDIYAQILVLFLSNLAKTGLASVAILFIFSRLVTRHLSQIARHVRSTNQLEDTPLLTLNRPEHTVQDELDDITEAINNARQQMRDSVKDVVDARKLLQLVLDTSTSGIVGLDANGQVVSMNPAARHLLGCETRKVPFPWPEGIVFLKREDLRPLDASADPIRRSLVGSALKGETNLMTRVEGENPRYVRVSSAPVMDDSQILRTVVVLDDVSEQENHRQQIERAGRLDALGQLTGGIAHDFNNLLATILYATQLMQRDSLPPDTRKYLDTVIESVKRGSSLNKRLLAFAKRQPGVAVSRRLGMSLKELDLLVQPTIEKSIRVSISMEEDDLWIFCDQVQLENALLNVVLNARDAIVRSGKGNRIDVRARSIAEINSGSPDRVEDPSAFVSSGMHKDQKIDTDRADGRAYRYVEIAVTDNGPGMSEEVRRRAVDPFFTTKSSNSGTGLGLSMTYGFIQQSNGELRIYSEEGHGTTVRMILPRGTPGGTREDPIDRVPVPDGGGRRILVVEDEVPLLDMMEELLKSLGYQTLKARSGPEALAILDRGEEFDLLLTDIVMPGIGGFELAKRVRQHRPEVAVVYMSGYAGFGESEMGEVVAPLVRKPSPPAELSAALSSALFRADEDRTPDTSPEGNGGRDKD